MSTNQHRAGLRALAILAVGTVLCLSLAAALKPAGNGPLSLTAKPLDQSIVVARLAAPK